MHQPLVTWLALLCAAWLAGCTALTMPRQDDTPRDHAVYVRSNGWHTAILVPRAAVAATGLLPETGHLPNARFLEFGWGDREYYPAPEATLGMTLRAALLPTPSVIQMGGRDRLPETQGRVVTLRVALTEAGFRNLVRAIADTFARAGGGPAEPVESGLYPESRFYAAEGTFHLFNTCNTWTARMLRAGGVPIASAGVMTAHDLMIRLRAAGSRRP